MRPAGRLFPRRNWLIAAVLAAAVVAIAAILYFPNYQGGKYREKFDAPDGNLSVKDRIDLEKNAADIEKETRNALIQLIGGAVVLTGLYFTFQTVRTGQETLRVTEEGKLTDRFSKAVEMLGNETALEIRLGGIYALERIARDSERDHWTVMEILTAFVRENSRKPMKKAVELDADGKALPLTVSPTAEAVEKLPREDIQAIMTVIGRREWRENANQKLDLQNANLSKCRLIEARLDEADLTGADFSGAVLIKARLQSARLVNANFTKSYVNDAKFNDADLSGADFTGAIFEASANTSLGVLGPAWDFTEFRRANLTGANFGNTNLSNVDFLGANLTGTDLQTAQNLSLEQVIGVQKYKGVQLPPAIAEKFFERKTRDDEQWRELTRQARQSLESQKKQAETAQNSETAGKPPENKEV